MSKRLHIAKAESYEQWAQVVEGVAAAFQEKVKPYPERIDGAWHDVTDALMALYHYVLAFAPQEEE